MTVALAHLAQRGVRAHGVELSPVMAKKTTDKGPSKLSGGSVMSEWPLWVTGNPGPACSRPSKPTQTGQLPIRAKGEPHGCVLSRRARG
ncbi:hypothetical protein [Streptomyces sp. UG1]|uniref:hypothetical protein n=1 Tax=Streptomyces sp. UG1 TaxID=3417652 RepID=UPI003CEE6473